VSVTAHLIGGPRDGATLNVPPADDNRPPETIEMRGLGYVGPDGIVVETHEIVYALQVLSIRWDGQGYSAKYVYRGRRETCLA